MPAPVVYRYIVWGFDEATGGRVVQDIIEFDDAKMAEFGFTNDDAYFSRYWPDYQCEYVTRDVVTA